MLYLNPDDGIYKVLNYIYIAAYIVSIITRIGIIFACYSFVEPPLKKLSYTICKIPLTLNTRLRSNSTRGSINYQPY